MDSRGRNAFGGRGGRGGYPGRGGRPDCGGGPGNTGDRSRGLGANQGTTNTGTTGINDPSNRLEIRGSRKEIQKALQIFSADRYLQIYIYTPDSGVHMTDLGDKGNVADKEEPGPKVCGNCGAGNHKAAFCVKTGRSGWMEACPKCDSPKHVYEARPQRKKGEEDFIYLVFNRQRKPPVKSTMKLGKVIKNELARAGTKWHQSQVMELPYSSRFARQEAQRHRPELWGYPHVGNPTEEAKRRTPEPDRTGVSLSYAADRTTLRQQAWSQNEEEVHPAEDRRMLPMHSARDVRGYKRSRSESSDGHLPYPKRRILPDRREPSPRRRSPPKDPYPRIKPERLESPQQDQLLRSIRPIGNPVDFSVDFYDGGDGEKRSQRERHDPRDERFSTYRSRGHGHHHNYYVSDVYPRQSEAGRPEDQRPSDRQDEDHGYQRDRGEVSGRHKESHDGHRGRPTHRQISGGSSSRRVGSRGVIPKCRRWWVNGRYVYKDVK